jgi:hypothetical protein
MGPAKPFIWVDAFIGEKSKTPLQQYLEDKLAQLMRKVPQAPDPRYSIKISEDARAEIISNHDPREEIVAVNDPDAVNQLDLDKDQRLNMEIAMLDRGLRLEREKLAVLKDQESVAMSQAEQSHRLRRDRLLALLSFITLCLGELGAIMIFIGDWLGVDMTELSSEISRNPLGIFMLIPVSVGFFAMLLLAATKVVRARREERYLECAVYLLILVITGGCLGLLRAFQITQGVASLWIIIACVILTVGVPIAAATAKLWWRASGLRLDEVQAPLRNLRMQIRESEAHLKEMDRERADAVRRKDALTDDIQHAGTREAERRMREDTAELTALKEAVAKMAEFKRAYNWFARKRGKEVGYV